MNVSSEEDMILVITRYLSCNADAEEAKFLKEWIKVSDANLKYFQQIRNIWEGSGKELDPKTLDTEKSMKNVFSKIKNAEKSERKLLFWWQKIAAVLIIPLLLGNVLWFVTHPKNNTDLAKPIYSELYAAFGTRSALTLSDGTRVWLNSGSSIKYPDKFIGKKRNIYLNGEAYFEVKSDTSHPFIVSTSLLNVEAVGTKFSVSGFKGDSLTEVSMVSGKVNITRYETSGMRHVLLTLDTCQHLTYNNETFTTTVTKEDTYKYYSWKDGKLIFRNEPLSQVVKKIGQVFNIDIELRGGELQDYRYRATFQDESLSEILKLLKISSPIDYYEVKRDPLPDGSFPRKKVVIFSSKLKNL